MTTTLTLIKPTPLRTSLDRATYLAALALVEVIDDGLATGRRHYRNRRGMLLTNLDEVVRAIINKDLPEAALIQPVEMERAA